MNRRITTMLAALTMTAGVVHLLRAGDHEYGESAEVRPFLIAPLPAEPPPVPDVLKRAKSPIDQFIAARWAEFDARPAQTIDDLTFLRRVCLDIAGVVPTLDEVGRFLDDDGNRRAKVIDRLLDSPRYADHWTAFWGDLLLERTRINGTLPFGFRDYIRTTLADDKPYDEWVREMLSADGTSVDSPGAHYFLRHDGNPEELTIATTQIFLGTQIKCAQCHDHPFEPWLKQEHFNGMRDFWIATTRKRAEKTEVDTRAGSRDIQLLEVFDRPRVWPKGKDFTGRISEKGRGRDALADLVTRRDNPFFARAAVNRIWSKLMGSGLVDPVDGFSASNPPSHPELLDWLAIEFIEHNYSLKHVVRLICNSQAYQLETTGGRHGTAPSDQRLFEQMPLRRMTAEQLHDSILAACGAWNLGDRPRWAPAVEKSYPANANGFLATFGTHDRASIHERETDLTIPQALELLNGDFLNTAIGWHRGNPVREWADSGASADVAIERLFYETVTRKPDRREQRIVADYIKKNPGPEGWSDLLWTMINTREFMFIP